MSENSPASPQASPKQRPPLYLLIEEKLGEPVSQFIASRREQDPPVPYYQIAYEVQQKTGVNVTHEAIRRWFLADGDTDQPETEPAAEGQ